MKNNLIFLRSILLIFLGLNIVAACSSMSIFSKKKENTVPTGWILPTNSTFVSHLEAKETTPAYQIDLQRKGKSKEDRHYIKLAESLYPDSETIRSYQKNKKSIWYFEKRWWVTELDGYRIPYSITGDTVNYYIDKYRGIKENLKKQQSLDPLKREYKDRVNFHYNAEVIREKAADGAGDTEQVIVKLSMKWYVFCGQPCGWGFEKTRKVTFKGVDQILRVDGDGLTTLWQSSPESPYAPQQWISN